MMNLPEDQLTTPNPTPADTLPAPKQAEAMTSTADSVDSVTEQAAQSTVPTDDEAVEIDGVTEEISSPAEETQLLFNELWGELPQWSDEAQQGLRTTPLTAIEAYGGESSLVASTREVVPYRETLTDHPIFQGMLLLLAVAYSLMVCAHLPDMIAFASRSRSGEGRSGGPVRAIHTAAGIGLLLMAALLVRLCEGGLGERYGTMTLLLTALGALLAIGIFQSGILALVGRVVLMRELTSSLIGLKMLFLGLGTLLITPPALLMILAPAEQGFLWSWLLLGMVFLVILIFIKESISLFLAKKISLFHWFLYLCTVECLPISFVWLLALRW